MPIYEYQCHACGERLEKLQKISDPVLVDCPACQRPTLRKMVTAAGFRLKGSGWYETDFKTDGKRNLAGDQDAVDNGATTKDSSAAATNSSKAVDKTAAADSGSKPDKAGDTTSAKTKSRTETQPST